MVCSFLNVFISNFEGVPRVLSAGKLDIRSKTQFKIGSIIASLGQTYFYLAYTAFMISWSSVKLNAGTANKYAVWIFAFLVVIIPIWKDLLRTRLEDNENGLDDANPQAEGNHIKVLFVFIVFSFYFSSIYNDTTLDLGSFYRVINLQNE